MASSRVHILLVMMFVALAGMLSFSCKSVLNDVVVEDPSLIRAAMTVGRAIDKHGTLSQIISVYLYDKHGNYFTLQRGGVSINGRDLVAVKDEIGIMHYTTSRVNPVGVFIDSLYEVKIDLGDGNVFPSSVRTQARDLYELNVPSSAYRNQTLAVSWKDADARYPMKLLLHYSVVNDTGSFYASHQITIPNPALGSFTIAPSYLSRYNGRVSLRIELVSTNSGQVHSQLMSTSSIISSLSVSKLVEIQ